MTSSYCHNPYLKVTRDNSRSATPEPACDQLPSGTLHEGLRGLVNFYAYPVVVPDPLTYIPPKEQLTRVFVGQLPYAANAHQAEWIVKTATKCQVHYTEIIHSWSNGRQAGKGCVHTYCLPGDSTHIQFMSKCVFVDDTGVWVAEDDAQVEELNAYCDKMKRDKSMRFPNRPFQPVVLEAATSTFRPREGPQPPPAYVATPPPLQMYQHDPYARPYSTSPPPPAYEETMVCVN